MSEGASENPATSYGQILRSSSILGGTNALNYLVSRKVGGLFCDCFLGRKSRAKTLTPAGPRGFAWDARAVAWVSDHRFRQCPAGHRMARRGRVMAVNVELSKEQVTLAKC